tara:strand:+ start:1138 stop:1485 length:348 start_codon:yes stop_codon:yes gene_type:complete
VNDDAALYLSAAVIEQAVRDWRAARNANLIDMNGNTIRINLVKLMRSKGMATFETAGEVESLKTFFFGEGLEAWVAFARLNINPDFILYQLENSVKHRRQHLHWQKHNTPRKESF